MKFEVTHEGKILTLIESTPLERKQLGLSLTKKLEYYKFLPENVKSKWNGIVTYFHKEKYVPIGLWKELKYIAETFKYELKIKGIESIFYRDVSFDEFNSWVYEKFKDAKTDNGEDFFPRDYQIEASYKILTNKFCLSELATSAGKSLIIFMCIAYFQEKELSKNFLMVVPSIDLVIQAYNDFNDYNSYLKEENRIKLDIKQIHGSEKKDFLAKQNIHIGTFQSLINFKDEYFLKWDCVVVDECHKAKANSIKEIIGKCINSTRRFGVTGTIPKEGTLDSLTLQAYLGPKVIDIKAKDLQEQGHIADIKIAIIEMEYPKEVKDRFDLIKKNLSEENKNKLLKLEQDFIITYENRVKTICNVINKIEKNQLVLFHRQEYGKVIKKYLEENTDKEIFFIFGETKKDIREEIKLQMKQGTNKVLVASFGTLSTGVSINNLHSIHFTESFKSDIIIRQSIGRGLRQHKEKSYMQLFDYVDKLNNNNSNILYFHSKARRLIYKEQGFPFVVKNINI
jgi:superfamily II DNA or RNA helicase